VLKYIYKPWHRAWKGTGDRLQNRVNHDRRVRSREKMTDIRKKYSFVNKTIQLWNQLSAGTWSEGKVIVKYDCSSSRHYVFHCCYCLVYSMLDFLY
jgi:hypothetical protein